MNAQKSTFRTDWKRLLPDRHSSSLSPDFEKLIDRVASIRNGLQSSRVRKNHISVVCSVYNGRELLLTTLREISRQLRHAGLTGDIFIVLNAGGGNVAGTVGNMNGSKRNLQALLSATEADRILYCETDKENRIKIPKSFHTNENIIRMIFVLQKPLDDLRGKIRALSAVYSFLSEQNQRRGYTPEYLLAIDAETRIRPVSQERSRFDIITESITGLDTMLTHVRECETICSSRFFMSYFDAEGNPDWNRPVPPLHQLINFMIGSSALKTLNGGATLGHFADMVAIHQGICDVLPRCRQEDALGNFIVKALGMEVVIVNDVVHANLCPKNSTGAFLQFLRWRQGLFTLRELVGPGLFGSVYLSSGMYLLYLLRAKLFWPNQVKIGNIAKALLQISAIDSVAADDPDDWKNGAAYW